MGAFQRRRVLFKDSVAPTGNAHHSLRNYFNVDQHDPHPKC